MNPFLINIPRKISGFLFLLLIAMSSAVRAQQSNDSTLTKLIALRIDFIGKIKSMGYAPSLKAPEIVMDNPFSFGNYDDKTNILHIGNWNTLPPDGQAYFNDFAEKIGNGMTGQKFFQLGVDQWIFIHEMGHWWRACQHQTAGPYENEKAANRIASAYWAERDKAFYTFVLSVFHAVVDHSPSPVPAGRSKEQFLNDNYGKLPGPAYSWYQSVMIVEISSEKPFITFARAIDHSGNPLVTATH